MGEGRSIENRGRGLICCIGRHPAVSMEVSSIAKTVLGCKMTVGSMFISDGRVAQAAQCHDLSCLTTVSR